MVTGAFLLTSDSRALSCAVTPWEALVVGIPAAALPLTADLIDSHVAAILVIQRSAGAQANKRSAVDGSGVYIFVLVSVVCEALTTDSFCEVSRLFVAADRYSLAATIERLEFVREAIFSASVAVM